MLAFNKSGADFGGHGGDGLDNFLLCPSKPTKPTKPAPKTSHGQFLLRFIRSSLALISQCGLTFPHCVFPNETSHRQFLFRFICIDSLAFTSQWCLHLFFYLTLIFMSQYLLSLSTLINHIKFDFSNNSPTF